MALVLPLVLLLNSVMVAAAPQAAALALLPVAPTGSFELLDEHSMDFLHTIPSTSFHLKARSCYLKQDLAALSTLVVAELVQAAVLMSSVAVPQLSAFWLVEAAQIARSAHTQALGNSLPRHATSSL